MIEAGKFELHPQCASGARRSRRFSVKIASGLAVSIASDFWTLKRRERRAPSAMRRLPSFLILLLAGFATTTAHAHDPYEITATASVLTDRFEVVAVLEYRAARLLAGRGWPTNQLDEAGEFVAMQPALKKAAEQFFQVSASGKNLRANSVAVQLGVENHVTFTLGYPAVGAESIVMAAPGLAPLAPEGQYGVGLTVLDMVRKKVLGQHVFAAANPLAQATFAPLASELAADQKNVGAVATVLAPAKSAGEIELLKSETKLTQKSPLLWPWFVAAVLGMVLTWRRRRKSERRL